MPGPGNSRWSLETPSGQWLDPSIAQTYTGDEQLEPPPWMAVPTSAAADLRGKLLGTEQSGKGVERPEWPGKGAEWPGKGARQPGKGAERNTWSQLDPLCHTMQQIAEYKPFEPRFVNRVVLLLSPVQMGEGWWKTQSGRRPVLRCEGHMACNAHRLGPGQGSGQGSRQ